MTKIQTFSLTIAELGGILDDHFKSLKSFDPDFQNCQGIVHIDNDKIESISIIFKLENAPGLSGPKK